MIRPFLIVSIFVLALTKLYAQNSASFSGISEGQNICNSKYGTKLTADSNLSGTFTGSGVIDNGNGTGSFNPHISGEGFQSIRYSLPFPIIEVSTKYRHTLVIKSDGTLWAWGYNTYGIVGNGGSKNVENCVQIGSDTDWVRISAGYLNSIAIKKNGTLWGWGYNQKSNSPVQIGTDTNWLSVVAGRIHMFGIKKDSTLWAWGSNADGQLGDTSKINHSKPSIIDLNSKWKCVDAGYNVSFGIKTNGTLWGWGYNSEGYLGDGTTKEKKLPTQIGTDSTWEKVTIGYQNTFGLKKDGTIWGWGNNLYNQIHDSSFINMKYPNQMGTDTNWKDINAGSNGFCIALKNNGTLWGRGYNGFGQLGNYTTSQKKYFTQVGNDSNWVRLALGYDHSMGIDKNNVLFGWGGNDYGELGDSTIYAIDRPSKICAIKEIKNITVKTPNTLVINDTGCSKYTWTLNNITYRKPGYYKDTISNSDGCDSVVALNLKLQLYAYVSKSNNILTVNSNLGINYQWYDCDKKKIVIGEKGNTFIPTSNGNYAVIYSNSFCTDTSDCYSIMNASVNKLGNSNFSIYPNPTSGNITIDLFDEKEVKLELYNSVGQLIKSEFYNAKTANMNIDGMAGIYFIKVNSLNYSETIKVIKNK